MSDVRAAYLRILAQVRTSDAIHGGSTELMSAAVARLEEAIREGQGRGTVRAEVEPRRAAELLVLLALGLAVWDEVGLPPDSTSATDCLLTLIEKPAAHR